MKRMNVKKGMILGLFVALFAGSVFANGAADDVVGTWSYDAPYAPYEYSTGKLIFTESGDKLAGKIKIGEYEIEMRNVKSEGDNVSFGAYVEGEYVSIKISIKKKEFSGTASYSEGSIEVTGKKE